MTYKLWKILTFKLGLCALVASSVAQADEVQYLAHGGEAFQKIADEVSSARQSIDITYYIFAQCHTSAKVLMRLVQKKMREGVDVRLLIDADTQSDVSRSTLTEIYEGFSGPGKLEVKFYNLSMKFSPTKNFRSHAKLLLIDGEKYISGGRNIADDYFRIGEGLNYLDRDIWVKGKSARFAQAEFNHLWNSPWSVSVGRADPSSVQLTRKTCMKWTAKEERLYQAVVQRKTVQVTTPVLQCSNVDFVMDDYSFADLPGGPNFYDKRDAYLSGERYYRKAMTRELIRFLQGARKNILMENWGYIPTGKIQELIDWTHQKKIPLKVVTNRGAEVGSLLDAVSPYYRKRDNRGTQTVKAVSILGSLRDSWALTPKKATFAIHSKVYVVDQKDVAVTSFNLDPRSYHTNIENGVIVRNCPALARVVQSKTAEIEAAIVRDKTCEKCQQDPKVGSWDRIKGWLGHELL